MYQNVFETDSLISFLIGFGPFRNYDVNPSWEIVKDIELDNVNLVKKQIEVSYEAVNQEITKIWKELKPNVRLRKRIKN